jgi:hypothetical protein
MASLQELLLKATEAIELSDVALAKADTEFAKQASEQALCEPLIKQAIDALVKHERIDPSNAKIAAEQLRSHKVCLEALIKTADPAVSVRPQAIGRPSTLSSAPRNGGNVNTKLGSTATAPAGSLLNIITDARVPVGDSQADKNFAQHFLGSAR